MRDSLVGFLVAAFERDPNDEKKGVMLVLSTFTMRAKYFYCSEIANLLVGEPKEKPALIQRSSKTMASMAEAMVGYHGVAAAA